MNREISEIRSSFPIRAYFLLTKPGIILGNAITASAGFVVASKGHIDFWLFLATLVGLSCVIGAACVSNNYLDRDADKKMLRTQNRALVKGSISVRNAILFSIILGLSGILLLNLYTNLLTLLIALVGVFVYVVVYGILKYRTMYGTLIGSIAGAVPPVVGYCAVSNHFDLGALILFMIVVLWQMPHFYAIAMYRLDDYVAASIPVLPIKQGSRVTKIHMLLYIIAFTITASLLTIFGYTGYAYLIVAVILGIAWLMLCIKGFKTDNDKLWARKMFLFSLVVVTVLSMTIMLA